MLMNGGHAECGWPGPRIDPRHCGTRGHRPASGLSFGILSCVTALDPANNFKMVLASPMFSSRVGLSQMGGQQGNVGAPVQAVKEL